MKILVTGSEGFIGSYLVPKLEELNHVVIPMDIKAIGDVRSIRQCRDFVKGIDTVIHMAALVDVQESIANPRCYHNTNVLGTLNMLNAALLTEDVRRFIYISSAAAATPVSPYGIQKLTCEMYCNFYWKSHGIFTKSLRPFNVYGPGNSKGVIDKWIKQIKSGERPIVYGGKQTRDFIYVDDVVSQIIYHMTSTSSGVEDIATGRSTNMFELCSLLLKVMDRGDLTPVIGTQPVGEIDSSVGIPCQCRYTLEQGLRKMVKSV